MRGTFPRILAVLGNDVIFLEFLKFESFTSFWIGETNKNSVFFFTKNNVFIHVILILHLHFW